MTTSAVFTFVIHSYISELNFSVIDHTLLVLSGEHSILQWFSLARKVTFE